MKRHKPSVSTKRYAWDAIVVTYRDMVFITETRRSEMVDEKQIERWTARCVRLQEALKRFGFRRAVPPELTFHCTRSPERRWSGYASAGLATDVAFGPTARVVMDLVEDGLVLLLSNESKEASAAVAEADGLIQRALQCRADDVGGIS